MSNCSQETELDISIAKLAATEDAGGSRQTTVPASYGKLKGPGHLWHF